MGYASLRAEGFETTDEVVFALPTDLSLLGVRTIEGFGVMVDNLATASWQRPRSWPDDRRRRPIP